jgi:asparagine N-glycosylation enzyme membrane subunit Stt3
VFDVIPLSYPLVVIPTFILLFLGFFQSPFSHFITLQLFESWFFQLQNASTCTPCFNATHCEATLCPFTFDSMK